MITRLAVLVVVLVLTASAWGQEIPSYTVKSGIPAPLYSSQPHLWTDSQTQPICPLTAGATVHSDGRFCVNNPRAGTSYQSVTLTGATALALPTHLSPLGGESILYIITHSGSADGPTLGTGPQQFVLAGGAQYPECGGSVTTNCWSTGTQTDWLQCVSLVGGTIGCGYPITNMAPAPVWSLVAHTSCGGNACTTAAVNATGGDLIVVNVIMAGSTPTISDSSSNAYTLAVSATASGGASTSAYQFYKQAPTVSSSMTFSSNSSGFAAMEVAVFRGSAASPVDQTGTATAGTGTSISPSATPTANNELVVASLSYEIGTGLSVGNGFTITDSNDIMASVNYSGGMAYLVQTTAAAATANFTWSTSSAPASVIVTYK